MNEKQLKDDNTIGPKLRENLIMAGYETVGQLQNAGAEAVFVQLRKVNPFACVSMLYGVERCIQEKGREQLDTKRKNELLKYFRKVIDSEE